MKLVLLSGGSGKRLWPLSNDSRSKQFLKILEDPAGNPESMVQRIWRQLAGSGFSSNAFLATGKIQVEMIQSQLSADVPLIVEPERRDTFPAIALACAYLYSIAGMGLNETVIVLPVDSYVEDHFFAGLHKLDRALADSGADLALMGVRPTFPSEKYGYMVPISGQGIAGAGNADAGNAGEGNRGPDNTGAGNFHAGTASEGKAVSETPGAGAAQRGYMRIGQFREKPDKREAARLIARDALWNCGIFAFKLDYLISKLIERGWPVHYEEMAKQYARLPKISFDYEVVEKAEHIVAVPYEGDWKDLGTWNTLTEEMKVHQLGKGIISDDSRNTHLINELDIPVTVLGLDNVVVAASPDGILVSEKSKSPRVKDVMKHFEQRPMYEERRWGWYKVVDHKRFDDGMEMLTKRFLIRAGKNISYQLHTKRSEVWTVVAGEGQVVLDGRFFPVRAGSVLEIPQGTRHSAIAADTDLEIVEVQLGTELVEEDTVRLTRAWDEITQFIEFEDWKG